MGNQTLRLNIFACSAKKKGGIEPFMSKISNKALVGHVEKRPDYNFLRAA